LRTYDSLRALGSAQQVKYNCEALELAGTRLAIIIADGGWGSASLLSFVYVYIY